MSNLDWSKYPNFQESEFKCHHTGKCEMDPKFMSILQAIRTDYAKPMIITSGYRDRAHPAESSKERPGEHAYGMAADILVSGENAIELLSVALKHEIGRIGIKQHGPHNKRFIHLGYGDQLQLFPKTIWSY